MNRYITLLGIVLAVLAGVFSLANLIPDSLILLLSASVVLIGAGSITGQ